MKRQIFFLILFVCVFLHHALADFGKKDLFFRSFSVNHGLSQYDVTSILQDKIGYIWIGTYDGLNRYDGFKNTIYRYEQDNENSLPGNRVLCLAEDYMGNIWIGTEDGGLGVFSVRKKKFITLRSYDKSLPESITSICLDNNKIIYGTSGGKLFYSTIEWSSDTIYLEPQNINLSNVSFAASNSYVSSIKKIQEILLVGFLDGELILFAEKSNGYQFVKSINNLSIENIFIGKGNEIWVSTFSGLKKYRYLKDYDEIIDITPSILHILNNKRITSVFEDDNGNVWISTYNEGLYVLHDKLNRELTLSHFSTENSRIGVDNLNILFIDNTKTLWIGSHRDGIRMIDLQQKEFYRATFFEEELPMKRHVPNEFFISSCFIDNMGITWIGIQDHALFMYDADAPGNKGQRIIFGSEANTVSEILEDSKGNLWFATWYGLFKFSYNNRKIKSFKFDQLDSSSPFSEAINNNTIFSICEDIDGNIWVGSTLGLFKINTSTSKSANHVIRYTYPDKIQKNLGIIFSLVSDPEHRIIIAGSKGSGLNFIYYNSANESVRIKQLSSVEKGNRYLSNNNVWAISATKNKLWVGTDGGLNLIEKENDNYSFKQHFLIQDGLPSNKITSIEVDFNGNIWMGTGNGLSCLNLEDTTFRNYFFSDGLQSNIFTQASSIDRKGILYFGGIKGLNYFNPEEINDEDLVSSNIQITSLYLNQKLVEPENDEFNKNPLENDIPFYDQIELAYFNNFFSFEFVNFQYSSVENNDYEYKLDGYDRNWIKAQENSRIASYSRVPNGDYTFSVRLVNNKNSLKSISVIVERPPWLRWWAYFIYFIITFTVVLFIYRFLKQKTKHKNDLLIEQHKREQEHHLNEMKIKFFINISHELRTPLTLIVEPIDILRQSIKEPSPLTQYANLAYINSQKLLGLITQLLDFRKTETGNIKFNANRSDLVTFLQTFHDLFNPLMEKKSINFSFINQETNLIMSFDKDMIDKIISNLLSNAIKFTPVGGNIDLILELNQKNGEKNAVIKVKDDGDGIAKDSITKIFDRFYQNSDKGGFGIGLAFSKNLAKLHGGDLFVESEEGKGSCFSLEIPILKYDEDKHQEMELHAPAQQITRQIIVKDDKNLSKIKLEANHNEKKVILLVEDNDDLRNFLAVSLSNRYEVLSAMNGKDAYNLAKKNLPDLIISDVMMPVMDGFALAKKIQEDTHTTHIPIIFLTAKDRPEDQLKGVEYGAVDYIVKPFSLAFLQKKISNLLNTISLQQDKYRNKFLHEPVNPDEVSLEEEFIIKAHQIIKENLNNSKFNVEIFCATLGVSRMQLHRKIKGVLGQSTTEFIRSVRLKHAAELLKTGKYNVSQSMYESGFDNPSYFTKSFKKLFGKTPSEFVE